MRPRTDNRDRSYLLEKVFASDNKHYHDTRHEGGLGGGQGEGGVEGKGGEMAMEREREGETEYMVRYQLIKSVNAVNEITQHAISFTLFGTLVIFGTPLYDL